MNRVFITAAIIYCSIGFFLSQLLHSLIFYAQNSGTIIGFPHYNLPVLYAIRFSLVLFFLSLIILTLARVKISSSPAVFLFLIIPLILISQIFGRSLIKFGFESAFCFIVFLSLLLKKHYGDITVSSLNIEKAKFFYNELWETLKLSVTICIFWLGTVGVAFAVQFLNNVYFNYKENPAMSQYQMFRYGIMFVYSVLGIVLLFYYPLFSKIFYLRNLLLRGSHVKKGNKR